MTEQKLAKKKAKKEKKQKFWADFKKFITRGNVVDMAVGVAVASAFTAIVTAFTKGFISPLLALLTKDAHLSELKWILRPEVVDPVTEEVTVAEVSILYGNFLQAILDFLIIALSLFMVMRIAAAIKGHYEKIAKKVREIAREEELAEEKRKAEEAAAAEAEKAAEAARIEAEKAAAEAARIEAEKREVRDRADREEALLREIRDLLREKK